MRSRVCLPLIAVAYCFVVSTIVGDDQQPIEGEPYTLHGKRLVFTNWHFVRQGGVGWVNDAGDRIGLYDDAEPGALRFQPSNGTMPRGIRLMARQAEQRGPIIHNEMPWEAWDVVIVSMLQDGDTYKAWGRTAPSKQHAPWGKHIPCYFESADGYHWQRPKLGIREFNGSKANNLLGEDAFHTIKGTVFIDPIAPSQERYKLITMDSISKEEFEIFKSKYPDRWMRRSLRRDGRVGAVLGFVSADGLSWRPLGEPLAIEMSDTHVICDYDILRQEYVAYFRSWLVGEQAPGFNEPHEWSDVGRRCISHTASDTFGQFPISDICLIPGPELAPHDVLYQNTYCTIPGAPEQRLMFPDIWHLNNDTTDIGIASSPDGRIWNFLPGSPVIHTREVGKFDGGCIFMQPRLIETANGDFAIAYMGFNVPHKYPRGSYKQFTGYAVWPHGRIIALEAEDRGEFETVSVVASGSKVYINAVTTLAGEIRVAVRKHRAEEIEGRGFDECIPIVGDHPRTLIRWQHADDLGIEPGEAVALKFKMDQAAIYGLEFE